MASVCPHSPGPTDGHMRRPPEHGRRGVVQAVLCVQLAGAVAHAVEKRYHSFDPTIECILFSIQLVCLHHPKCTFSSMILTTNCDAFGVVWNPTSRRRIFCTCKTAKCQVCKYVNTTEEHEEETEKCACPTRIQNKVVGRAPLVAYVSLPVIRSVARTAVGLKCTAYISTVSPTIHI